MESVSIILFLSAHVVFLLPLHVAKDALVHHHSPVILFLFSFLFPVGLLAFFSALLFRQMHNKYVNVSSRSKVSSRFQATELSIP
jgi:hypothetical protein